MKTTIAYLTLLFCLTSFAQTANISPDKGGEGGGGGDTTEVQKVILKTVVKESILKIKKFFISNPAATERFPEINFEELYHVIDTVQIEITEKEIKDKYGIIRTAVNYPTENKIVFNQEKLEKAMVRMDVLIILCFHELLGIMGVEENDPNRADLALNYATSGKLTMYLVKTASYELKFKKDEPVNYDGCKIYVGKIIGKQKDALNALKNKGYVIVKRSKDSDFTLKNNHRGIGQSLSKPQIYLPGSGVVDQGHYYYYRYFSTEIEHNETKFRFSFQGYEREATVTIHPYNQEIRKKVALAKTVNERSALLANLRPELDTATAYISEYLDTIDKIPACSELLGKNK